MRGAMLSNIKIYITFLASLTLYGAGSEIKSDVSHYHAKNITHGENVPTGYKGNHNPSAENRLNYALVNSIEDRFNAEIKRVVESFRPPTFIGTGSINELCGLWQSIDASNLKKDPSSVNDNLDALNKAGPCTKMPATDSYIIEYRNYLMNPNILDIERFIYGSDPTCRIENLQQVLFLHGSWHHLHSDTTDNTDEALNIQVIWKEIKHWKPTELSLKYRSILMVDDSFTSPPPPLCSKPTYKESSDSSANHGSKVTGEGHHLDHLNVENKKTSSPYPNDKTKESDHKDYVQNHGNTSPDAQKTNVHADNYSQTLSTSGIQLGMTSLEHSSKHFSLNPIHRHYGDRDGYINLLQEKDSSSDYFKTEKAPCDYNSWISPQNAFVDIHATCIVGGDDDFIKAKPTFPEQYMIQPERVKVSNSAMIVPQGSNLKMLAISNEDYQKYLENLVTPWKDYISVPVQLLQSSQKQAQTKIHHKESHHRESAEGKTDVSNMADYSDSAFIQLSSSVEGNSSDESEGSVKSDESEGTVKSDESEGTVKSDESKTVDQSQTNEPSPKENENTSEPKTSEQSNSEQSNSEQSTSEPKTSEPKTSAQSNSESKSAEPTTGEPKTVEPTTLEPKTIEPTTLEPKTIEPTTLEPKTIEPTPSQPKTVEPATAQPQTSDPNASQEKTANLGDSSKNDASGENSPSEETSIHANRVTDGSHQDEKTIIQGKLANDSLMNQKSASKIIASTDQVNSKESNDSDHVNLQKNNAHFVLATHLKNVTIPSPPIQGQADPGSDIHRHPDTHRTEIYKFWQKRIEEINSYERKLCDPFVISTLCNQPYEGEDPQCITQALQHQLSGNKNGPYQFLQSTISLAPDEKQPVQFVRTGSCGTAKNSKRKNSK